MNCLDAEEVDNRYGHFLLDAGDYVVSSSGTIGRIAEVSQEDLPCMLNTSVIRMRPKTGSIQDSRFLRYFLTASLFQNQIESFATGSAQRNYGPMHLKMMWIVLPPQPEQRAIAHILGTLDDKIELNRRMNETLEAMARALFKSWFVDFDPVRAKLDGRWLRGESLPGLPAEYYDLFPDRLVDSELGEVPEGWEVVPLPEAIEINPARSLRKGDVTPYLDMANMPMNGHTPDTITERPFGSGMRFTNGDTLVARITPCLENGKTAYVDFLQDGEVGWGSTEYIVMSPKPPLPKEFAYCLARSAGFRKFAIQNMTGTSGRQRVPAAAMSSYHLPLPCEFEVMELFGELVEPLFSFASQNAVESRTLTAQRDALLPRLVSGQLRVVAK